jgi:hypothetical protein
MPRFASTLLRYLPVLLMGAVLICGHASTALAVQTGTAGTQTQTGTAGTQTQTGTAGKQTQTGTAGGQVGSTGLQNPLKNINSLEDLLDSVLAAIIQLGTIILTLALVYTGFLFVMARGNPEEISKARGVLLWTVIGGLILLGAQGIKSVIFETAHDLTNGI